MTPYQVAIYAPAIGLVVCAGVLARISLVDLKRLAYCSPKHWLPWIAALMEKTVGRDSGMMHLGRLPYVVFCVMFWWAVFTHPWLIVWIMIAIFAALYVRLCYLWFRNRHVLQRPHPTP